MSPGPGAAVVAYDAEKFKDWTHKDSGAPVLKDQHPEFEIPRAPGGGSHPRRLDRLHAPGAAGLAGLARALTAGRVSRSADGSADVRTAPADG